MASIQHLPILTGLLLGVSASAEAGRWEFGLGVSNTDDSTVRDAIPAMRASARMERGAFGFFSNVMVRPNGLDDSISSMTESLLRLSLTQPISPKPSYSLFKERGVLALGADWSFGQRFRDPKGLSGGPRLYVELEARLREAGWVSYADNQLTVTDNKLKLNIGPAFGASLDVWMNQAVGLRIGIESRISLEEKTFVPNTEGIEPSSVVSNRFGLTIDLLFGTGGAP